LPGVKGSCGKPRLGLEVRLVDENDIPVAQGEIGELIVRADTPWLITPGYFEDDKSTSKAWRNGWFHSGDLLRCDEDGNYFFHGRRKDALRRRGELISSEEVEYEVVSYKGVKEAACVAVPAEFGEDDIKVFLVVEDASTFDLMELAKYLAERMPYFMVPRYFEFMSSLPRTETHRVKKVVLRDQGNTNGTWDREKAGLILKRSEG